MSPPERLPYYRDLAGICQKKKEFEKFEERRGVRRIAAAKTMCDRARRS
jgi:hypothetical protein